MKSPFASPVAPSPLPPHLQLPSTAAFIRSHRADGGWQFVARTPEAKRMASHTHHHYSPYSMLLATNDRIIRSTEMIAIAAQQRHGKFPSKTNGQGCGRLTAPRPTHLSAPSKRSRMAMSVEDAVRRETAVMQPSPESQKRVCLAR